MNIFVTNNEYRLSDEEILERKRLNDEWHQMQEMIHEENKNKSKSYEEPYEWGQEYGYVKH